MSDTPVVIPLPSGIAFLWGAGGSLAVEIFAVYSEARTPSGMTGVSSYYRSIPFWILRLGIAAVAGGLAVAEEATKPIIAINIGAAAPAVLQLLTRPVGSQVSSNSAGD